MSAFLLKQSNANLALLPFNSSFGIREVSVGNHPIIHGLATTSTTISCSNNWGKIVNLNFTILLQQQHFFFSWLHTGTRPVDDVTSYDVEILFEIWKPESQINTRGRPYIMPIFWINWFFHNTRYKRFYYLKLGVTSYMNDN